MWSTCALHTIGCGVKFPPPTSGTRPTSTSLATLAVYFSGGQPTLPWRRGRSWIYQKSKVDNTIASKVEGLVGLFRFFVHPASIECDWGFKRFGNPYLVGTYHFWNKLSLSSLNISYSAPRIIAEFSEDLTPWGGLTIWEVWIGTLFDYCLGFKIRFSFLYILSVNFAYRWGWLLVKLVSNIDKCSSSIFRYNWTRIHVLSSLRHSKELGLIPSEDTSDDVCCMMISW